MLSSKKIVAALLSLGLATAAQAALVEGQDFKTLPEAIPQLQANKIEVLEFFAYFCIHCKNLNPTLQAHIKTFPNDTYFRSEHVVWSPEHIGFARIAAAVNATGLNAQADGPIFKAVMDERINLGNPDTFKQWVAQQTSFDGKKLLAAYNGFQNQAEAKKMAELTTKYQIQATPVLIVGGKYQLQSHDMGKLDELINKVRQERGLSAPQPKATAKAKATGARLATQANQ